MNKPTTKSIFVSRLKNSGYTIDNSIEFGEDDNRKWQILLDRGHANVLVTCYKDGSFEFYDGQQFHNASEILVTSSIEVVFQYLNDKGMVNKHPSYHLRYSDEVR